MEFPSYRIKTAKAVSPSFSSVPESSLYPHCTRSSPAYFCKTAINSSVYRARLRILFPLSNYTEAPKYPEERPASIRRFPCYKKHTRPLRFWNRDFPMPSIRDPAVFLSHPHKNKPRRPTACKTMPYSGYKRVLRSPRIPCPSSIRRKVPSELRELTLRLSKAVPYKKWRRRH